MLQQYLELSNIVFSTFINLYDGIRDFRCSSIIIEKGIAFQAELHTCLDVIVHHIASKVYSAFHSMRNNLSS
jgi:hypothetical protein